MSFREARPASAAWNVFKTFLQTCVVWGVLLILVPWLIMLFEDAVGMPRFSGQHVVGGTLFCAAGSLGLWSGYTMAVAGRGTPLPTDCARRLVVAGPYRFIRNPMAVAGLTQGAAVAIWLGSWLTLLYTAAGFIVWNYGVRRMEERDLEQRFRAAYDAYRRAVKCWLPRWRR